MKKIIIGILILLFSREGICQYTSMFSKGYQFKYTKHDSGFVFPVRDTLTISGFTKLGSAVVRPGDSSLYLHNGVKWERMAIDSAGLASLFSNKVDSVKVLTDTLFYYINGVAYGSVFTVSNIYPNSLDFDDATGDLTIGRNGSTDLTENLDGRYSLTTHTHSGLAPLGGTTGQVLKKSSSTDYDYDWYDDSTGFVPVARTLTINGVSYDLSVNRTWNIPYFTATYQDSSYLNAYGNFVEFNTDSIPEGSTNLYFTNARARGAISLTTTGTSGAATYNSTTGVLNVPNYAGTNIYNTNGTLTGNRTVTHSGNYLKFDLGSSDKYFQLQGGGNSYLLGNFQSTFGNYSGTYMDTSQSSIYYTYNSLGVDRVDFAVVTSLNGRLGSPSAYITASASGGAESFINFQPDSITIKTENLFLYGGQLIIDTQFTPANSTDNSFPNKTLSVDDTYLWYRKSNGTWVKVAWTAF